MEHLIRKSSFLPGRWDQKYELSDLDKAIKLLYGGRLKKDGHGRGEKDPRIKDLNRLINIISNGIRTWFNVHS